MKRESFVVLVLVLTLTSAPLNAGDRYLCVPQQAAGFSFDESLSRWKSINLVAEDVTFIISKVTSSRSALAIVSAESNNEECRSKQGFVNTNEAYFECVFGEFRFNKSTGRFLRTYTAGYTDGLDNQENTPAIVIGRCSSFQEQ